jgi:hypothetical protein
MKQNLCYKAETQTQSFPLENSVGKFAEEQSHWISSKTKAVRKAPGVRASLEEGVGWQE